MDKANGLDMAAAKETDPPALITPGAADPTPAGLAALIERLRELGHPRATIANLADKLGVKRPTLIRWIDKGQPFAPEAVEAARTWESNLQAEIERWEAESGNEPAPEPAPDASPEPQNGPGWSSKGDDKAEGEKAVEEPPEGAQGGSQKDDAAAEWERRQRQYAPQGSRGDGRDEALIDRFEEALARLERASPRPATFTHGFAVAADGVLDFDEDYTGPTVLPMDITDRLTRAQVHMLVADPNVGKTTWAYLMALAIALELALLVGQAILDWCGSVMVVSNEDAAMNGSARWREQRRHLKLSGQRLKHKLSVWPTRLTLGQFRDGALVPTESGCEFVEVLATRAERGVHYAYIVLDPLTGLFPGVTENDAVQMNDAIVLCERIAHAAFAAVDIIHHTSKSTRGQETITAYRGGTGSEAASGELSTLAALDPAEIAKLGFPPVDKPGAILRQMGHRKRNGGYAGTYYFRRDILRVAAVDPREPGKIAAKPATVAVLTWVPAPIKPGVDLDVAHRALWDEHQTPGGKGKLTRGGKVSGHIGSAVQIVMERCECDRPAAEAAVDELAKQKRVKIEGKYPGGKSGSRRLIITPERPENEAADEAEQVKVDDPY